MSYNRDFLSKRVSLNDKPNTFTRRSFSPNKTLASAISNKPHERTINHPTKLLSTKRSKKRQLTHRHQLSNNSIISAGNINPITFFSNSNSVLKPANSSTYVSSLSTPTKSISSSQLIPYISDFPILPTIEHKQNMVRNRTISDPIIRYSENNAISVMMSMLEQQRKTTDTKLKMKENEIKSLNIYKEKFLKISDICQPTESQTSYEILLKKYEILKHENTKLNKIAINYDIYTSDLKEKNDIIQILFSLQNKNNGENLATNKIIKKLKNENNLLQKSNFLETKLKFEKYKLHSQHIKYQLNEKIQNLNENLAQIENRLKLEKKKFIKEIEIAKKNIKKIEKNEQKKYDYKLKKCVKQTIQEKNNEQEEISLKYMKKLNAMHDKIQYFKNLCLIKDKKNSSLNEKILILKKQKLHKIKLKNKKSDKFLERKVHKNENNIYAKKPKRRILRNHCRSQSPMSQLQTTVLTDYSSSSSMEGTLVRPSIYNSTMSSNKSAAPSAVMNSILSNVKSVSMSTTSDNSVDNMVNIQVLNESENNDGRSPYMHVSTPEPSNSRRIKKWIKSKNKILSTERTVDVMDGEMNDYEDKYSINSLDFCDSIDTNDSVVDGSNGRQRTTVEDVFVPDGSRTKIDKYNAPIIRKLPKVKALSSTMAYFGSERSNLSDFSDGSLDSRIAAQTPIDAYVQKTNNSKQVSVSGVSKAQSFRRRKFPIKKRNRMKRVFQSQFRI